MTEKPKQETKKETYTDEQINELAEWWDNLTFRQLYFLKQTYEGMLIDQSLANGGNEFIH